MTMQMTNGGNLLKLTAGSIAKECCCGTGETSACSLEAPCASGNPSMQVTVFDAGYTGGDITWCNEIWTNQQVKDGDTRCVCPTSYYDANPQAAPFPSFTQSGARQNWGYGTELNLDAFWEFGFTILISYGVQLKNRINVRNGGMIFNIGRRVEYNATNLPTQGVSLALASSTGTGLNMAFSLAPFANNAGNVNVSSYGLGTLLTRTTIGNTTSTTPPWNGSPNQNAKMNGRIGDNLFGQVVTTGGVTYSWKKGVGWP